MGIIGHLDIGQFAVIEFDVDVVADLAVPGEIGWGLVGDDGKNFKLPPQNGGKKAVEGLPGFGDIPGEDGHKDLVFADIGDIVIVKKLNGLHSGLQMGGLGATDGLHPYYDPGMSDFFKKSVGASFFWRFFSISG
jgi:hypothetical protein